MRSNGYFDLSDEDLVEEILRQAEASEERIGVLKQYKLRYRKNYSPTQKHIVFADISGEMAAMRSLVKNCSLVCALSLAVFFGISLFLARWAVRPVEKAWNQQRQFVADASHELKTPLTVIMTNAELLQDPVYGDAERQGFAEGILTMSRQMRNLVEGLLELARVDNGTAKMEFVPLDFSTLAADCMLIFEPVFFERSLSLESWLEPGLRVRGSETHLRQVLEILLDNAAKYTTSGMAVTVRLCAQGNGCLFSVSGPGEEISREDLENIFKRFYRGDKSRHRDGGYGLGLAIADSIIREHKGKIWAQSEGGINTFFVQLPGCL